MSNYPDGLRPEAFCYMEGCLGNGRCPRCGKINYSLMGYYGAISRWAKVWGVSKEEAETRIEQSRQAKVALEAILGLSELSSLG